MKNNFDIKKIVKYTASAILAINATACATYQQVEKENVVLEKKIDKKVEAAKVAVPKQSKLFVKNNGFYAEKKPISNYQPRKYDIPKVLTKNVIINEPTVQPLAKLMSKVSLMSGVKVFIAQDVDDSSKSASMAPAPIAPGKGPTFTGTGLQSNLAGNAVNADPVYHTGTLYSLLDDVTTKMGLSWKWDGENVQIYKYETRVFSINALNGDVSADSSVSTNSSASSSGGAGGGSGTSGTSTKMTQKMELWKEVESGIKAMATNNNVTVMQSSGQIVVKDTPLVLSNIEKFVNSMNKNLSKQVMVNVEIYSVDLKDTDAFGVDWNVVFNFQSGGNQVVFNPLSGDGVAAGIKNGIISSLTALGGAQNPTPFEGSSFAVGALSKLGNTSLVTSASMVTLNGLPVPVQVTREQAYVKSMSTTVTGTSGTSQTQITPDTVSAGISLNITPKVTDNNKVLLQYAVDLTDIVEITEFSSGGSKVQLPVKNVRNFLQRASMKSGETLVLTGFKQNYGSISSGGVGSAKNFVLGNGKGEKNKTEIVVLITPVVVAGE